jgi:hypothetical protein
MAALLTAFLVTAFPIFLAAVLVASDPFGLARMVRSMPTTCTAGTHALPIIYAPQVRCSDDEILSGLRINTSGFWGMLFPKISVGDLDQA